MDDKKLYEEVLSKEEIYEGKIFRVEKWQAKLPNDRIAPREIVLHKGAAAIVPVDSEGYVTLVRQYRIASGVSLLEIPAGKKDSAEEDFLVCAQRELAEETGYRAKTWRHLTTLHTSPGFLTETIGLFLATDLTAGETNPDEDEFLNLYRMPLSEAVQRVLSGEITDSKTICGLLMAWELLKK